MRTIIYRSYFKNYISVLITVSFLFFLQNLYSQDNRFLKVIGYAEKNEKPLSGAKIELYEGNSVKETQRTISDGKFTFRLDLNKEYTIVVSKEGFVSKKIKYNTSVPDDVEGKWITEFAMSLFRPCGNVNTSALNEPVDIIKFNQRKEQFESDGKYAGKMRYQIQEIYMNIDDCQQKKYDDLIDEADQLLAEKKYEEAKAKFEEAMDNQVVPDEYPKNKIIEINNAISKTQSIDELYSNTISRADAFMAEKKYDEAKRLYEGASRLKPSEQYAGQKLKEIATIQSNQQAQLNQQQAVENEYRELITRANTAFADKNYPLAKQLFEKASAVKPGDTYTGTRIQQINNLIAQQRITEEKNQAVQSAFNTAIAQANMLYEQKNYTAAKEQYKKALTLKPDAQQALSRISEIDKKIIEEEKANLRAEAATRAEYNSSVRQGDSYMINKQYEPALAAYKKASSLKPEENYPRSKITEINTILAQQQKQLAKQKTKEESYNKAIAGADNFFNMKQYDAAKTAYRNALSIKPQELYPKNKLAEIERIEQSRLQAEKEARVKEQQYTQSIQQADILFNQKKYTESKNKYNLALSLKPDEQYPKSQIIKIDNIIAQNQKLLAEQKANEEAYNKAIAGGDNYLKMKQYASAKTAYRDALNLKPQELYPKNKIAEIDRILQAQLQAEQETKALEEKYNQNISYADNLFGQKKYPEARSYYNQALSLKPSEMYPKTQISKIDDLIAQQQKMLADKKAKEEAYKQAVASADSYFRAKQYESAKSGYRNALNYKPEDTYSKAQITKTDNILAQIEKEKQEKLALENAYNEALKAGNLAFNSNDYATAKVKYNEALRYKPNETYPRSQLNKITSIEAKIARQSSSGSGSGTAKPVGGTKPVLTVLNFKTTSELENYLKGLRKKYPDGVTLEVYKEKNKVTERYIVIRNNEVREFRGVKYSWGGDEYSVNGKPITAQYFNDQVKNRPGEYFEKTEY